MSKDKKEVTLSSSLPVDIVFKHANRRKSESDKHKKDNEFETTDAGFVVGSYNPNKKRVFIKEQMKNDVFSKNEKEDDGPSVLGQNSLDDDQIFGDIEM